MARMRWDEYLERIPEDRDVVGVEIGVWFGDCAKRLLAARPRLTLVMVDPWPPMSSRKHPQRYTPENIALARRTTYETCVEEFKGRGIVVELPSVRAAALFDDRIFDFVAIDADHRYKAVRDDIRNWLCKVRSSGWIGGHDYAPQHAGVIRAVDEMFGRAPDAIDLQLRAEFPNDPREYSIVETGADATWFVRIH